MAGLIDHYLLDVERRLSFDPILARRAHDDLTEHFADGDNGSSVALARFGTPDQIAAAYAHAAFPDRMRQMLTALGWMTLATFAFMRLRSLRLDLGGEPWLRLLDGAALSLGLLAGIAAFVLLRRQPRPR
ncbi:hypothetical protein [Sandaracinobacteroides saxicola]|uniref:Uncharacterized protein n=1 Tax=Sandaracinobacteroides saxicola TaxID=2759707 RepID=A0A7G5IM21_9SPHN|nr:hypothetical protein [Sandaracinobacteroides saxicola]QMW24413.1 hypothetical protein H3309_08190 [Sandaracinobacteroides saxicola]